MKMKKLQAILLAGILCMGSVVPAWAGEFSDSTQAEVFSQGEVQAAGQESLFTDDASNTADVQTNSENDRKTTDIDSGDKDYALELSSQGSVKLHYQMGGDRYNLFGGIHIKNVGKKDVSLTVTSQKYVQPILNYSLQAGEEDTLEFSPVEENIIMGEFTDDILTIEDSTGNIHMEMPLHLAVTGDGGFSVNKKELDFGEYQKGETVPEPQTIAINVEDGNTFYDTDWKLLWKKGGLTGNLEGNVNAEFDKNLKTVTVTPREDLDPGWYEGYLSIRNEAFDNWGHQEDVKITIKVLPEKAKEDYAVKVNCETLELKLDLSDEDGWDSYGAFSVTNIGAKPVELNIKDSIFAEVVLESDTSVAQPGETIYYTCEPVLRNIVVSGETYDGILVTDTTGNIYVQVPVHVTVTDADVFSLDKNELNFGMFTKGETPPMHQGVKVTVKDGYSVADGDWTFTWDSSDLEENFSVLYDNTLGAFVIGPKKTIEPGCYLGRLSIRNGDIGQGEIGQEDIMVSLVVASPIPKITKVTVNKNMITANISTVKGGMYDCHIVSKGSGGKEKIVRQAWYQTGTKVVFRNVPKGTYDIEACGVYEDIDDTEWTESTIYKNVKVKVSTPSRPSMVARVSGKNVKLTVSKPKNTAGYNIRIGTGRSKSDDSKTEIFTPVNTVYSKNGQTAKTVTLKNLKKGTYYVGVQAYSIQNGQKVYSQWSKLQKITIS